MNELILLREMNDLQLRMKCFEFKERHDMFLIHGHKYIGTKTVLYIRMAIFIMACHLNWTIIATKDSIIFNIYSF